MTKQNLSERKKKLRQKNPTDSNVNRKTQETAPQKISRDAKRKQRYEQELTPDPVLGTKRRFRLPVDSLMLKLLLTFVTIAGLVGIIFFEPEEMGRKVLRGIGTAGVPLAIFLLTEGYYHTKSRARYFGRLLFWGILAQLPMEFLITYDNGRNQVLRTDFEELNETDQFLYLLQWRDVPLLNYLFTLLFAFLFIWLVDIVSKRIRSGERNLFLYVGYGSTLILILIVGIVLGGVAQTMKLLEAPVLTVMLVFICVLVRDRKELKALMIGIVGVTFGTLSGPEGSRLFIGIGAGLPAALFVLYDGKLGYDMEKRPFFKYAFYMAYVAAISVLVVIGMYLFVKTHEMPKQ